MGIVEDTTTDDEDEFSFTFPDLESADDEATLLPNHERTPLLKTKTHDAFDTINRGSLRFSKPRTNGTNTHKRRSRHHHSTSTDIKDILSELQDEDGGEHNPNADPNQERRKRHRSSAPSAPMTHHSPSDADDSLSPSPSATPISSSPPSRPLFRTHSSAGDAHPATTPTTTTTTANRRHLRAHTLTGTGIDVHLGAGIGSPAANGEAMGLNPNASAYARQMREQRRKRRRWASRYRSASLTTGPAHKGVVGGGGKPQGHRAPGEAGGGQAVPDATTRSGSGGAGAGAGAGVDSTPERQQGGASGWVTWLLGKSTRRKETQLEGSARPLLAADGNNDADAEAPVP